MDTEYHSIKTKNLIDTTHSPRLIYSHYHTTYSHPNPHTISQVHRTIQHTPTQTPINPNPYQIFQPYMESQPSYTTCPYSTSQAYYHPNPTLTLPSLPNARYHNLQFDTNILPNPCMPAMKSHNNVIQEGFVSMARIQNQSKFNNVRHLNHIATTQLKRVCLLTQCAILKV